MKPTLLIVDDDEGIQTQMKWALTDDYEVILAQDRESARQVMVETQPDVVLLDLGLPPHPNDTEEGFKALGELLADSPLAKIIVITGAGRAFRLGAASFQRLRTLVFQRRWNQKYCSGCSRIASSR